jgi:hypothetical protein
MSERSGSPGKYAIRAKGIIELPISPLNLSFILNIRIRMVCEMGLNL